MGDCRAYRPAGDKKWGVREVVASIEQLGRRGGRAFREVKVIKTKL